MFMFVLSFYLYSLVVKDGCSLRIMPGQNPLQPHNLQILKMADQTEQFFPHFTYVFLHAHLDGVKRKICVIKKTFTMFCRRITSRNKL